MQAFTRKYIDIPAELNVALKTVCAEQNKSQRVFIAEAITEKVAAHKKPSAKTPRERVTVHQRKRK